MRDHAPEKPRLEAPSSAPLARLADRTGPRAWAEYLGVGLATVAGDDTRGLVSLSLVRPGFDVPTAADGQDALAAALDHRPDVAVSDVTMPGRDGGSR